MSEAVQLFIMATKGELVWTWCPRCGDRQNHLMSENGQWRCTRCGTAHPITNKPKTDKGEKV